MSSEETITASIDKIFGHLRNVSIFVFIVFVVLALLALSLESSIDPKTNPIGYNASKVAYSILTGFLPTLLIAILIKPIYDLLIKVKANAISERRKKDYEVMLNKKLNELKDDISYKYDQIASIYKTPTPVSKFYSSFYDIEWDHLLKGAKTIDLCAFYWTDEWMQENLPFFAKAIKNETQVNLYLPNPIRYGSEFTEPSEQTEKTKGKILQTIFSFLSISTPTYTYSKISVFLVPHAINYMLARVQYDNGTTFMYSPFINNKDTHIGNPPVVLLDVDKAEIKLKDYIKGEIEHLQKGQNLVDFEASKYITWSDDGTRLIISMALSCPAPCKFCYIKSVLDGNEEKIDDDALLGTLLAYAILNDERFKKGVKGTTILLGGLSDPFYPTNTSTTIAFIKTLKELSINNILHIATRFCAKDEKLIDLLSKYKNLIVNYSVTSMEGKLTMGNALVKKRFDEAKELSKRNIFGALYIRPVIPGVTIKDIPQIINYAKDCGIKHVTVGGLYFDERIIKSLSKEGVEINRNKMLSSKFIMDKKDKLKKAECQEVEKIKRMLLDAGLEVFSSSKEIANDFRRKIS